MDKAAILHKVQQAAKGIPNTGPMTFAINTLRDLEQRLQDDVRAEAEAKAEHQSMVNLRAIHVAVPSESVTDVTLATESVHSVPDVDWEFVAKRRLATCKRLRAERDALQAELNQVRTAVVKQGRPVSDFSNLVSENAGLRVQLRAVGGQLDHALNREKAVIEERLCLQSENEGLASDLRKCQAESAEQTLVLRKAHAGYAAIQVENETLRAELTESIRRRDVANADEKTERFSRLVHQERVKILQSENDAIRAKLSAATVTVAEPCPVSDRLAALEDHVELMGAQFEAYCRTTNERMDESDKDGETDYNHFDACISDLNDRLDALKNV